MNASTGGSVVITARLSPITGEATAIAVASSASRRHAGTAPVRHARSRTPPRAGPPCPAASHTPEFPARPARPQAGRARQAEQRHHRQVGVIGQPGGHLRGGQVGRAMVDQQRRCPVDDDHPRLRADRRQTARATGRARPAPPTSQGGGGPAAPAPQDEQGRGVTAGRPDGPDLIPARREDGGDGRVRPEHAVRGHEVPAVEPRPVRLVGRRGTGRRDRTHPAVRALSARAVDVPRRQAPVDQSSCCFLSAANARSTC